MTSKRVFVSYDYDNDRHYKNLLVAWAANASFDLEFYDNSVDVSVNSADADYIKRVIRQRIQNSHCLLCIVGTATHRSNWVAWEIRTASDLGKTLLGVKVDRSNTTPSALLGAGTKWAMSFNFDSIRNVILSV